MDVTYAGLDLYHLSAKNVVYQRLSYYTFSLKRFAYSFLQNAMHCSRVLVVTNIRKWVENIKIQNLVTTVQNIAVGKVFNNG